MDKLFVIFCMLFSYYALGGMATTNIYRLIKGETMKQTYPHCHCGACGHIIPLYNQFPFFSYTLNKGKCKYCGIKIPVLTTIIEIGVGVMMMAITAIFRFSPLGVLLSFGAYEIFRWVVIATHGKRKDNFIKEYLVALGFVFIAFVILEFMSVVYTYC